MKVRIRVPTSFPYNNERANEGLEFEQDPYMYLIWFIGECRSELDFKNYDVMTKQH